MYLQSLEIFGFKSFATKTILNFHRGVTAIVGPNGCGKSNVLDALRWVLGEQSAKALRGGEMADVIFSGADSRAALGMAEVSLTFSECEKELGVEWSEVRITRRVFRDGNSEYFLNKTLCRLKDIQQLFMDTGIGRSAYSIMEQGKIDLILSSRPEDRRAIFEEAAGITKFKSQRKEALRKLEYTEANLLRVTDIIKEVKRQIGSLQRQAGKARRYQALLADLKTLETHFARHQYDGLESALQETRSEIARIQAAQESFQASIEEQESAASSERVRMEETESELNAARHIAQELKRQIAQAEDRAAFDRERIEEFNGLISRYKADAAGAEEKLGIQQTQMEDAGSELRGITASLSFERERLDNKKSAAAALVKQRAEAESALHALVKAVASSENAISSLGGELQSAIGVRDGSETQLGILEREAAQTASALAHLQEQQRDTALQIEQSLSAAEQCEHRVREAESRARTAQEALAACDRQLALEQRRLSEKESKLEVLKQLNEEGEGFTGGTQAVLKGLDNPSFFKPAISGALASHIQVAVDFIPAIEAALGLNLQAIVMKDTLVGESIIKTLAAKKLGRASLALREFIPNVAPEASLLPEGAISWAADKVDCGPDLAPLLATLLHRTAIVGDLEKGLELKRIHAGVTFVTLAGEIILPAGIVLGGQAGEVVSSVLQRNAQIGDLEKDVASIEATLRDQSSDRERLVGSLAAAQSGSDEAREENQQIRLAVSSLQGQLAFLERELKETNARADSLRWECESTDKRRASAVEKLANIEERLAREQRDLLERQSGQAELQERLVTLRRMESEANSELNELRISVATEQQRYDSLNSQLRPMAARLTELKDIVEQRSADAEAYRQKISLLEEETAAVLEQAELDQAKAVEAEARVSGLQEARARTSEGFAAIENSLRVLRRQLSEGHDHRSQQEVKATQCQLRIENLCEHVTRRYQLDLKEFQPDSYALICAVREQQKRPRKTDGTSETDESMQGDSTEVSQAVGIEKEHIDWARVEEMVRELDQRLDAMGPINVDAIQEYDELEQRYTFLEKQNSDLTASKAELLDVISRINSTTRELFAATFEQIRVNFQEMFTELFGGGKANLVLADESDPLESGIEIVAKPPGKQLQAISLLSGGEKTMTAVSLLFSIYMVKPSPFCVLDEMDAPLDESNINRFIKILDRFVSQSQFVVITHNKRTIAKADVLYGVTMEEQGVSKLVGVKFSRREDSQAGADLMGTSNPSPVPSVAESFGKTGELLSETANAG